MTPRQLAGRVKELEYEAKWIRTKLGIPEDCKLATGETTLAGTMHVICSHAHGYKTYIETYKCDDKQGEIARLTVEKNELCKRVQTLESERNTFAKSILNTASELGIISKDRHGYSGPEILLLLSDIAGLARGTAQ